MMTEQQKQALSNWLPGRISHLNDKESTQEGGLTTGQFFQRASYKIALAALTQPASPALGLPDFYINRIDFSDDYGPDVELRAYADPLDASKSKEDHGGEIIEVKRLNAQHKAPIEPICATGGAEWTDKQCLEFLAIALRHANISGDIQMDDIRLGIKMVNAAAPEEQDGN